MELHQIRYFLAVERVRSFSRAAEQCHITQPALTRAIQRLEDEIGGKLFHRRPGKIEPTELGLAVLPRLQAADREIASARVNAANVLQKRRQRLRLGVICTMGSDRLLALVGLIATLMPEVDIEIVEAKGADVLVSLQCGDIDAAVVGMPHYPDVFDVIPLYRERYVLAMPTGHRFASGPTVDIAELAGENYVERTNCEFDEHFEFLHGDWPVELNVRYRCAREDWVQAMVGAGVGVAVLPESFPLMPGILTRPLAAPEMARQMSFVVLKGREPTSVLKTLRAMIEAHDWTSVTTMPQASSAMIDPS